MVDQSVIATPHSPTVLVGRVLTWLAGIVCYVFLLSVIVLIAFQIINPPPAQRILLMGSVPLPDGLKAKGAPYLLTPGLSKDFDSFDFQAIDPTTHLLFIAHTGPMPYPYSFEDPTFHWDNPADIARDGNIPVFDLQQQKLVGLVPIPRVFGLAVAPDLHKVFASASEQDRIYSFDEPSLTNIKFLQLSTSEGPDTMSYDPLTHRLFVATSGETVRYPVRVPGKKLPILNENRNPAKQNVYVIDARTLKILARINIGQLPKLPGENLSRGEAPVPVTASNAPKFGYEVGQIQYDEVTHLLYLVVQVSEDRNIRPHPLPPLGTAELITIDPVANKIIHRTNLPESCSSPHAMALDTEQHIAYIDCLDVDSTIPLVQHLMRMDLNTMKAFPDDPRQTILAPNPNMLALDRPQQLLFEACTGGVTVFDIRPGHFRKLGNYVVGHSNTLSIIVDESTQFIYLPVPSAGGRPTLYIAQYNSNGV